MRILALAAVVGVLGIAACNNDENNVVNPNQITGTFILQSVNGRSVPAIFVDSAFPGFQLEVTSGALLLSGDRTFITVTGIRTTVLGGDFAGIDTTRRVLCTGTFTGTLSSLSLVETPNPPACGRTFSATVTGSTVTTSLFGRPAVYGR